MPHRELSTWDFWKVRRIDKAGGYARFRRWRKRLERKGLQMVAVPVASFTLPDRGSDGKGSITIYRDVVRRMSRRTRRPDHYHEED